MEAFSLMPQRYLRYILPWKGICGCALSVLRQVPKLALGICVSGSKIVTVQVYFCRTFLLKLTWRCFWCAPALCSSLPHCRRFSIGHAAPRDVRNIPLRVSKATPSRLRKEIWYHRHFFDKDFLCCHYILEGGIGCKCMYMFFSKNLESPSAQQYGAH